ncbi:hypothetical protein [Sphaerospermopsis torques-reginae]|uniref:Bacteriocin n=1 Tax=Sphaerospermopsis torques-reginae ITEP-024 TaxID=984208 RepID=A0ABX8WU70_9CYAN|nr:hypothetical protein [Sphaerospermopsis torques-reginae]QYX29934.1 hypothetical protein K2F26_13200 [Sphaerospermopsis torques-reginae ITEP-024]
MSNQNIKSDLVQDISSNEQELLSGGHWGGWGGRPGWGGWGGGPGWGGWGVGPGWGGWGRPWYRGHHHHHGHRRWW